MALLSSDFVVIGGGIVGLATAYRLSSQYPDCRIILLEKEVAVAQHQSGRNSGVLHSGIYYKPGSLKATTCRVGKRQLEQFCEENGIRYELCGKVIVAVTEEEAPQLEKIFQRGQANGVVCELIDMKELHRIEPHAAGTSAIRVREAGIVDYPGVCRKLANLLEQKGHRVLFQSEVTKIETRAGVVRLHAGNSEIESGYVINCGGLHSDKLVRMAGGTPPARIVPFRGEYYQLKAEARSLCKHLIYPVPDPNFPFLGVHLTRMVDGTVECGPNAVLALAREGYNWTTLRSNELWQSLSYPGFLKLASKHWRMGMGEIWRSFSKNAFVRALQRLVPELKSEHLVPCRAGVRAQAVAADGSMVDDFLFEFGDRIAHVCNAPSPAATASLRIGELIVEEVTKRWQATDVTGTTE